ncbi:MAG: transposase [Gammaproteobacteria bacterium]
MGRPPRVLLPGFPHHVVQRGHNRNAVFVEPRDYEIYLKNLAYWKRVYDIAVQGWCLMTNHVHLVLLPRREDTGISGLMRRLSARQGRYVNRLEGRLGTLWCGRFHCSVVDSDAYLLACLRYVELNPVRAGIAAHPQEYPWSSYRERMGMAQPALLGPDAGMAALGETPEARRQAYSCYLETRPGAAELDLIRNAVQRNRLTGGNAFVGEIQRRTGLRIENRGRGRPRRQTGK